MKSIDPKPHAIALLASQLQLGERFAWPNYPRQSVVSLYVSIQYHAFSDNTGHAETANEKNARQRQQVGFASLRSCVKPAPKRTQLAQVASKNETKANGQVARAKRTGMRFEVKEHSVQTGSLPIAALLESNRLFAESQGSNAYWVFRKYKVTVSGQGLQRPTCE